MMALWAQLDWRAPWWGLLAFTPILFLGLAALKRARLLRYADAELLPWAVSNATDLPHSRSPKITLALAWLLLGAALAGPRLPLQMAQGAPVQTHALTVMLIMDVSMSMQATDIAPNRLIRARLEVLDTLPRLRGERVGVIVYAGEAGMLIPPTDDREVLRRALTQVVPDLFDIPGSNLAAALELARRALVSEPAKAILVVTDAETDSLNPAVSTAVSGLRQDRIPMFMLGVGTTTGAPITLADGSETTSRMDAASYTELARSTGGQFIAVVDGDDDSAALIDRGIAQVPGGKLPPTQVRAWRELYPWALLPALLLLMAGLFPRGASMLAVSLVFALGIAPTPSARADERTAWEAWQSRRYIDAQTQYGQLGNYPGYLGAGAAAWRLDDYGAAMRHFTHALLLARTPTEQADALYNLGNAYYGVGSWEAAIGAYQRVLQMRQDARAAANLAQAKLRFIRQRRASPGKGELYARRGKLAEGTVNLDWDENLAMKEFDRSPLGAQKGAPSPSASGAQIQGGPSAVSRVTADARRLQSGLKKTELMQERSHDLLKSMLKQDAEPVPVPLPPW